MSIIGSNILAGAAGQGGGYVIDNSLRFRSSASAYLNRTPATSGSQTTCTWSGWAKRTPNFAQSCLSATTGSGTSNNDESWFQIGSDNILSVVNFVGGSFQTNVSSSALLRDPSAWYHLVFVWDTTNATASERVRAYVNGVRLTLSGTFPTQNNTAWFSTSNLHRIGAPSRNAQAYGSNIFDGYLTEVNFIDGQALTPSDFGDYNEDTGVWQPAKYAGSYGTNGFYLNFSDATTTSTLAADSSGNGNDWTPNNISLTAGVTYDSMTDTPTPYLDGGNYAVLNPTQRIYGNNSTSDGNLKGTASSGDAVLMATMAFPKSGKFYAECTVLALSGSTNVEIREIQAGGSSFGYTSSTGAITGTTAGATFTINDVIGVAFDYAAQTVAFYKNGSLQGTCTGVSQSIDWAYSGYIANTSTSVAWNFGQRPFAYTPPTGFKSLHTGNLPDSAIENGSEYFNAITYSGDNNASRETTGVGFQPDFVWVKNRSSASGHLLWDVVRGTDKNLRTDGTFDEAAVSGSANGIVSTSTSDGFSFKQISSLLNVNQSGQTYVAWNWKAGGAAVTNTAGSITSQVSASPTAGFSVVTYTGTGSSGQVDSVGHGLGVAPKLYFIKQRNSSNQWYAFTSAIDGGWDYGLLNTTQAFASTAQYADSTRFYLSGGSTNTSGGTHVAYCFSEVPGYSSFGSYTGNGSANGPFVNLGFRPAFVMVKRTDAANDWYIHDTSMSVYNAAKENLLANSSTSEGNAYNWLDIVSNGFKCRTADGGSNISGGTYIYMAFAENDFANSLAR